MRLSFLLAVLTLIYSTAAAVQKDAPPLTVQVSTHARALRPGEVVFVTVTPSRSLASVAGKAFGKSVGFWPAGPSRDWYTVVGIPLDTVPGSHTVELRAADPAGSTVVSRTHLKIVRARFATRRLRVSPRFVNPPASAMPRIRKETEVMSALFARPRSERLWRGPFSGPVDGAATSSFGRLNILNGRSRGRHQGADFQAEEGTPVHAPNAGEVVLATGHYFSGNTIVLDHGGGLFSLLAHLSRMAVPVGKRVARGDRLGDAGATGRVTGPHLHWAVRLHGVSVDPLSLVAAVAKLEESPE